MALVVVTHHSAQRGEWRDLNEAPRGQKTRLRTTLHGDRRQEQPGSRISSSCTRKSPEQERVQRHAVEQMIESFVPVPRLDLDALVPQMVEHLVDVLKIFDRGLSGQVIEVPKVPLQDVVPHRAALRVPQLAEQLVDVPVPETVILARGRSAAGVIWYHVAARRGRSYWWMGGSRHVQWLSPERFTASPGR